MAGKEVNVIVLIQRRNNSLCLSYLQIPSVFRAVRGRRYFRFHKDNDVFCCCIVLETVADMEVVIYYVDIENIIYLKVLVIQNE